MVGGGLGAFIGGVHRMAARLDDRYVLAAGAFSSREDVNRASGEAFLVDPERVYSSFSAMAEAEAAREDGVDVVAIVTPNHLHVEPALAFVGRSIPVLCDKPLATSLAEATALATAVQASGAPFGVTYNYSAYPMIRLARELVSAGELGPIRMVQLQYVQDWLADPIEVDGQKQAAWRTDPTKAGPGGSLGDIATHAVQLGEFVSGLQLQAVAADLTSFVGGRVLDDNAHLLLRFTGGAKGMLWTSQVAHGHGNDLMLRVYGEAASLQWRQEEPEALVLTRKGEAAQRLSRGGAGLGGRAPARIPGGHPEGYLEAFATLYREFADQVQAWRGGQEHLSLIPTVEDGVAGVRFVEAAVKSSANDGAWTACA